MIKVLHCYKTYYPDSFGGIEQVIYQLSEGGMCADVDSTVFTLSSNPTIGIEALDHHKVYRSKSQFDFASTPFSGPAVQHFKKLALEADVIHYHFPYPFMDVMHFLAGIRKPTVLSYHSDIVKQKFLLRIYSPLMHWFLNHVDHIVAASPNYVASSPILQKHIDKVSVIPYGLDKKFYTNDDPVTLERWKKQFSSGFFLFIGAFRYYKGLHILIEAAVGSSYPIVIVGSGPIEQELKAQVDVLGIQNIYFLGALANEDKSALLSLSTCLVFPSHLRSEAFGISLLEGALYSKPLISSEIGTGTTYINIDGETGLVVPPSDPKSLRKAMDFIWDNPDVAQKFGDSARRRFDSLFTAEAMVEQYATIYRSLLNQS
jgi:rhamnosyl/mannosyltransferase